ncbi:putative xyloglucan endotransglucosylase/hydrolase protein 26, partial [Mucuna pruriens]
MLVALILFALVPNIIQVDANFSKSMYLTWGVQHASIMAEDLHLVLDKTSGSAAQSKRSFLFGSIEMQIKLVPGNSAGTVTAYYATVQDNHTRFIPTYTHMEKEAESNNFTSVYDRYLSWYVDSVPIRVYRNYEKEGIAYPNKQGMRVYTSLWNADNWATRGGLVKTNWRDAPFTARFHHFRARACRWGGAKSINQCASNVSANWWTSPRYKHLSHAQMGQLNWVRENYMIYDYCTDTKRFNAHMPPECFKPQF